MRNDSIPALKPAPLRWRWMVAVILYVAIQGSLCLWAGKTAAAYPATGLRFEKELEPSQIAQALEFQDSEQNTQAISVSFWGQSSQELFVPNGRSVQDAVCIGYCGNAEDCLPVTYTLGGAPGALGMGCAVSDTLADALFGGSNVVGQTVTLQQQSYTITGVFSAQEKVFLYPSQQNLTCAELRGVATDTPKADAEQWALAAGLGKPQCIVYGPQRAWAAKSLCWIPALLVAAAVLAKLIYRSFAWPVLVRNIMWFAVALSFALLLPYALGMLPGWLIPARWSDFSFWTNLAEQIRESQQAWQVSMHYWRDITRF